jgi:hypothetical protein
VIARIACVVGLGLFCSSAVESQDSPRVQVGMSVRPDTVTVGDPFVVRVRLRLPAGARVTFPQPPDTTGPVQGLDPVVLRDTVVGSEAEFNAAYRLAAWDVGSFEVGLGELLVRIDGVERRIPMTSARVIVRTVLPADSTLHTPKPPRPPMDIPVSNWWKWLLALLAIAAVGVAIWLWRRWRNRPRPPVIVDPLVEAEQSFARIESLGLLDAGERGRYVTLMAGVVREYLARRIGTPESLTSTELVSELRRSGRIPLQKLAPLLTEVDLIKFARYQVASDRARHLAEESRSIVLEVHQLTEPPPAELAGRGRAA